MSKAAIDIDALARQAMNEKEATDYLLRPEKLPLFPIGWQILMQPMAPKDKVGSFYVAKESKEVEKLQCTVGMCVAMGPTATHGRTSSGIVLADLHPSLQRPNDCIGKYFLYQRYTGLRVTTRDSDDEFLLITVSELLALVPDPDRLQFWI